MTEQQNYSGGAVALTTFASVMLMVAGAFQFFAGLAGILNDDKMLVTEDYVISLDTTAWGWIHLLIGIVLFLAGLSLLNGAVWARTVAVIVASVSAITAFVWLPAQPFWGLLIIVLDIFIIWAVTAHGRDIAKV
jgi:hypothetical protein